MSLYPASITLSIIHPSTPARFEVTIMNPRMMYARRTALALVLFVAAFFSITAQEKTRCNVKVTLLQVNDVYQFAPVDQGTRGGLGRLLTLRKSIRQENPNTLF